MQKFDRAVELHDKFVEFSKTFGFETKQHWPTSKIRLTFLLLWLTFITVKTVFPSRFQRKVILAWYILGGAGGGGTSINFG